MAKKQQLREIREGTIINVTSKKQETDIIRALTMVVIWQEEVLVAHSYVVEVR